MNGESILNYLQKENYSQPLNPETLFNTSSTTVITHFLDFKKIKLIRQIVNGYIE